MRKTERERGEGWNERKRRMKGQKRTGRRGRGIVV
jgi:hypothetical protein